MFLGEGNEINLLKSGEICSTFPEKSEKSRDLAAAAAACLCKNALLKHFNLGKSPTADAFYSQGRNLQNKAVFCRGVPKESNDIERSLATLVEFSQQAKAASFFMFLLANSLENEKCFSSFIIFILNTFSIRRGHGREEKTKKT